MAAPKPGRAQAEATRGPASAAHGAAHVRAVPPQDPYAPQGCQGHPAPPRDTEELLRPTLTLLRRELERRWSAETADGVYAVARYALLPPGKLLRPLLMVECAAAVGGGTLREGLGARGIAAAALGVEYLHVGSLAHDDVIDGDALRRGRPTVAAGFGTADAIVAGDALILSVFEAVAGCVDHGMRPDRLLSAVRVLAGAGLDMCRGQALEAELCGDAGCGLERYLTMIELKTGALIRGACQAGAVLGGGSPEQQHAARQFAEHLGRAFQMSDDLLPHLSDTEKSGKPALSDVANGRPTFPVLLAHEMADAAGRSRLESVLSGSLEPAEGLTVLREVLAATGALHAARERVRTEAARARECLEVLPAGRSRDALDAVAGLSVDREW